MNYKSASFICFSDLLNEKGVLSLLFNYSSPYNQTELIVHQNKCNRGMWSEDITDYLPQIGNMIWAKDPTGH